MDRLTIEQKKAMHFPVKACHDGLSIKDIDTTKRIITGMYNTCNYFDSQGDIVLPGCMNKSINERGPKSQVQGAKIKHALFHDLTLLPGKILTLEERTMYFSSLRKDITGIYFETEMVNSTLGNDTLINYDAGIYDNHSIGFRYMDLEMIDKDSQNWGQLMSTLINPEDADKIGYAFLCHELKLFEGSTVAFGANDLSIYLGSKSEDVNLVTSKLFDRLELLTKQVRTGRQSEEALYLFDLQIEQIKQMIFELKREPDIKDTYLRPPAISTAEIVQYLTDNVNINFKN